MNIFFPDGNPVTGEGYKRGAAEINTNVPAMNGAKQVINKNRVPPGKTNYIILPINLKCSPFGFSINFRWLFIWFMVNVLNNIWREITAIQPRYMINNKNNKQQPEFFATTIEIKSVSNSGLNKLDSQKLFEIFFLSKSLIPFNFFFWNKMNVNRSISKPPNVTKYSMISSEKLKEYHILGEVHSFYRFSTCRVYLLFLLLVLIYISLLHTTNSHDILFHTY